jgi:hypothetical protein
LEYYWIYISVFSTGFVFSRLETWGLGIEGLTGLLTFGALIWDCGVKTRATELTGLNICENLCYLWMGWRFVWVWGIIGAILI